MSNYRTIVYDRYTIGQQAATKLLTNHPGDCGGTTETPERFGRAWEEWMRGYWAEADLTKDLQVFADGAGHRGKCNQMITLVNLPFNSMCEHHFAPFWGVCSIGYVPNQWEPTVLGLSKFKRILDVFAKRLQTQERLTQQVAEYVYEIPGLKPTGVAVKAKARHMCMESRGVSCRGHQTETMVHLGFKAETHQQFLTDFTLATNKDVTL